MNVDAGSVVFWIGVILFFLPVIASAFGRGNIWQFLCLVSNLGAGGVAIGGHFGIACLMWIGAWVFAGFATSRAATEKRLGRIEHALARPQVNVQDPPIRAADQPPLEYVISQRGASIANYIGLFVGAATIAGVAAAIYFKAP